MVEDYDIVVIDPSEDAYDVTNLIAMCPTCGKLYARTATLAQIARIKDIKKNLLLDAYAMGELAHEKIEKGLRNVLRKVKDLDPQDIPDDLNYDPAAVRQKIKNRTNSFITKYR